jgi:prepilin-type N-terminal cleavage/methylation domain-containing protein
MKNKKSGFTLFELLVSISIIAILTVIAMVSFSSAQKKARDAKRIQDVDAVGKALEGYYSDNNAYPADLSSLSDLVDDYIQQLPTAIKSADTINYELINTTQACYCMSVEEGIRGNSTNDACTFATPGETTLYYCRKGQQE